MTEAATLVERAEANAWKEIIEAVPREFAAEHSIGTWRVENGVGFRFDSPPNPFFNRFHGLGVLTQADAETLARAVAPWAGDGRTFVVHGVPDGVVPGLSAVLTGGGLSPGRNWVKMIRGTDAPPDIPSDLRIEEVGTEASAAFASIAATAFELEGAEALFGAMVGRPGSHAYLAYDGSMPVATGYLRIEDEVGWLGSGSTLSSHRGRGAQGAIMARRIADGIKLGCRHLVSETGEETPEEPNPSYRNMLRTGFELVYARRNWIGTATG
jgi:hypothetical protein